MAARNRNLLIALAALGLALRRYHYLRGPSVWHDEAAAGRLKPAYDMGPTGWVAVDRREFAFTTVLLLERSGAKMASGAASARR